MGSIPSLIALTILDVFTPTMSLLLSSLLYRGVDADSPRKPYHLDYSHKPTLFWSTIQSTKLTRSTLLLVQWKAARKPPSEVAITATVMLPHPVEDSSRATEMCHYITYGGNRTHDLRIWGSTLDHSVTVSSPTMERNLSGFIAHWKPTLDNHEKHSCHLPLPL